MFVVIPLRHYHQFPVTKLCENVFEAAPFLSPKYIRLCFFVFFFTLPRKLVWNVKVLPKTQNDKKGLQLCV